MSGHPKWAERRRPGNALLAAGFADAIEASMWLPELRRAAGLTQSQLAARLGVSQSWVSQVESETDVRLSTLAAYVGALGADLRLGVRFPEGRDVDLTPPSHQTIPAMPAG